MQYRSLRKLYELEGGIIPPEVSTHYLRAKRSYECNLVHDEDITVWMFKMKARSEGRDLKPEEKEFIRSYEGGKRLERLLTKYGKR